jgi:hypothetical protein
MDLRSTLTTVLCCIALMASAQDSATSVNCGDRKKVRQAKEVMRYLRSGEFEKIEALCTPIQPHQRNDFDRSLEVTHDHIVEFAKVHKLTLVVFTDSEPDKFVVYCRFKEIDPRDLSVYVVYKTSECAVDQIVCIGWRGAVIPVEEIAPIEPPKD